MKAICLLSGGIDSPVAVEIAIRNGFQPILLHYHNFPFHSPGTLEKVVQLSNLIIKHNPEVNTSLVIIEHGETQGTILKNLENRELQQTCLFCRIQMFSKAEAYARKIGADIIVTGEILGEQASQTLDNLPVVISKIDIPVIRPLIGYNKEEVVQLSKKWGYYGTSILPGGCCSVNPKYPETKGTVEQVNRLFNKFERELEKAVEKEMSRVHVFDLPVLESDVLEVLEV
ncbi:MAG: 7-cyano-7-deazaguanine synthase [Candidatus Hodarchaeales archaeon]